MRYTYLFLKRLFDMICSLLGLIVSAPLWLIVALGIEISDPGPVFYIAKRTTKDDRVFDMYKFRSMRQGKANESVFRGDEDRIFPFGAFIRATKLDELPQLLNILIGDMSIVGPRPLMQRYLAFYTEEERRRHLVRPGLTGYAQVHGRNTVSWDDRIAQDLYYVDHVSFSLDLSILVKTILLVLKREGTSNDDMENFDDYRKRQWAMKQ